MKRKTTTTKKGLFLLYGNFFDGIIYLLHINLPNYTNMALVDGFIKLWCISSYLSNSKFG